MKVSYELIRLLPDCHWLILAEKCQNGPDICAVLLTCFSIFMIIITLPLSLLWSIKVVQVNSFHYLIGVVNTFGQQSQFFG